LTNMRGWADQAAKQQVKWQWVVLRQLPITGYTE
jgi:hypothetical protein